MHDKRHWMPAARRTRAALLAVVVAAAVSLALAVTSGTPRAASAHTAAQRSASTASAAQVPATPMPGLLGESATHGRVIVVLKDQHSDLNLLKQGKLRRELAFRDQDPILASIKAHGGSDVRQLVAVNAVAAKLSKGEVSRLLGMPTVAKVVPDLPMQPQTGLAQSSPAASVPSTQVTPVAQPDACPATTTSPTGVTGVVQEPEAMASIHASDGIPNDPTMANTYARGAGVTVANLDVNQDQGNPNFTRPDGTPVAVNVPPQDTTLDQGNDEFDEDMSSIAAQGTVVYQYDTGQTTGSNQGALPFSGLPPTCKFYVIGAAPDASLVDSSDLTTPPSSNVVLESQVIEGIDQVTDAAQPAFQANELSESINLGMNNFPQEVFTANDAAAAAGVAAFVSSNDSGDSSQAGGSLQGGAADPHVIGVGATDDLRLIALEDGFQNYTSNQMAAISSGGVANAQLQGSGDTFRVVDLVAPGWFGGESACVLNSGGCPSFYPTESARGTSESAPLAAGGAADVISAYRATHNGTSPTVAMLQSILDGTATDLDSPASVQGAGLINVYQAVQAAQQMPGTTDANPPRLNGLVPTPSQLDVAGQPGTTTSTSVSLYNTSPSPTTVTGTWRNMGPQFTISPTVTEPVSAPAIGTPIPPQGATAAAPITFNVPAGLDRLDLTAITPDPTNNTMLQIQLFDPNGTFIQESYDDGSAPQNLTSLTASTGTGATNIKVASLTDAVVGNKVAVDSGANEQIDTVAAVGKAATNTTLSAAASAGATNIKVGTDTNMTVGDTLTIDAGTSQENATVQAIGSASTTTALTAATAIGATTLSVSSTGSIAAGDTITIDSGANQETGTVKSIATRSITLNAGLTKTHSSGAAVFDAGAGVTLTAGLANAHSAGATVTDAGSGITLSTPLTAAHASGASVFLQGNGSEPNTQEIEVSAPMAGQWTARIVWNGVDQDVGDAPPEPGLYTGNVSVDLQGSNWQTSPATAPVTIPGHSSATIPVSYTFPGTPGDYPQSIQFAGDNGATTSYPFVGRTIIPTGFNIPFSALITSSVGRAGGQIASYFDINVPPGSQSISVNLTTPDAQADNKFTYYLINNSDTSTSCTAPNCQRLSEPVNGVNNGTLTVNNPTPGMWQVDVSFAQTLSGNEFTQVVSGTATVTPGVSVGGNVPSTLAVSIPAGSTAPSFGTFTPGVAQTYSQTVAANITSTAQSAVLTAADTCTPTATCFPGHLINTTIGGPYELAQGLQVAASDPAATSGSGVFTDLSVTNPATLLNYSSPVSNDPVTITLQQPIAATDPLRTGTYSKTITFTLSTNSP